MGLYAISKELRLISNNLKRIALNTTMLSPNNHLGKSLISFSNGHPCTALGSKNFVQVPVRGSFQIYQRVTKSLTVGFFFTSDK